MALDASKQKSESDVSGRAKPEAGTYLMIVEHVDSSQEKHDAIMADVKVLSGDPENQKGRSLRHMMFLDDEGDYTEQHLRFALATGVIKPGEVSESPDWSMAEGKLIIAGVEKVKNKKDDAIYTNISNYGMDIWSIDNPDAPEIPLDEKAVAIARGGKPKTDSGRQRKQKPTTETKKDDDWDL